jgi:hypothetical protein
MKTENRSFLCLEPLENRACPSVLVTFSGGNLTVTGDNLGDTITAKLTATDTVQVTAQSGGGPVTNLGTFAVTGTLRINGGNAKDTISLDLNGNTLDGSVYINSGNGGDAININNSSATPGAVGGLVSILSGPGGDQVTLDSSFNPLRFGGNVLVNTGLGSNGLAVDAGASIAGSLIATDTEVVTFGSSASAGSIVINAAPGGALANNFTFSPLSTVTSNVSVIGGSGSDTILMDSTVNGSMQIVFGNGANIVTFGGTGSVGGTLTYNGGGGGTFLSMLDGFSASGNVSLSLGNGANGYDLAHTFTVGGNMTLNGGNGSDMVGDFSGTVDGNLAVNLGNGTNTFTFVGTVNGTKLTYTGGSGNDTVEVDGTNFFALSVSMGSGSNTFTYGAATSVGSAYLDFGFGSSGDVYNDGGNTITWPQTIVNFTP